MAGHHRGVRSDLWFDIAAAVRSRRVGVVAVYGLTIELLRERRVAALAALLFVFSPFVWVQGATLLGYQLSAVLGTFAAWMLIRGGSM